MSDEGQWDGVDGTATRISERIEFWFLLSFSGLVAAVVLVALATQLS